MSDHADVLQLGEIVDLQRGTTYRSALLGLRGPVLLGLASIERNGGFRSDSLKSYGGESSAKLLLRPGDLYVSLKDVTQAGDLLGAVSRVPVTVPLGRLTQDTVKLTLKSSRIPPDYLYWLLRTPSYREYCRARATGTTNLSLSRDDFLAFPVPIPGPYHMTIVETLGALDDKIELNRRMAEALEGIARVAYAELQAGQRDDWTGGSIADVAHNPRDQVAPRQVDPSTPYIGLEHVPRGRMVVGEWGQAATAESGKVVFKRNDILFGKLRPYFRKVGVVPTSGICSTDILVIRARRPEDLGYVLAVATDAAFIESSSAASTGTRMPRTSWAELVRYPLLLPPASARAAFTKRVWPLIERAQATVFENSTLEQVRDTLLPRLLSGDIEVAA